LGSELITPRPLPCSCPLSIFLARTSYLWMSVLLALLINIMCMFSSSTPPCAPVSFLFPAPKFTVSIALPYSLFYTSCTIFHVSFCIIFMCVCVCVYISCSMTSLFHLSFTPFFSAFSPAYVHLIWHDAIAVCGVWFASILCPVWFFKECNTVWGLHRCIFSQ
jgi:hypothetical protein